MVTLTLSPDPDYGRMRVVVVGAAGGTLVRDGTPVRGAANLTGDLVVNDYECPFCVDVSYWVDGQPGGTVDQPVDIGGSPPTAATWRTNWSSWTPTWQADGVRLVHDREGDGVLQAATVVPVTPGERYRLAVDATGLVVSTATVTLFDMQIATDDTPDFFDQQTVQIGSGTRPVQIGAHTHTWELLIPTTISPPAGAGAPRTMRPALRLRPARPISGDTVKVTSITLTRLAVRAEKVTGRLDTTGPWLTHPMRPELSLPVRVVDDDPWTWETPGTAHQILGADDPVWTHTRRSLRTGVVDVASTWDQRDAMRRLLADGSPLLLRSPPGCYLDDGWLAIQRATRDKNRPHDPTTVRWSLEYTRVASAAGDVTFDPSNAWDALAVTHPTWQSVLADHDTWVDVLLTDHPHQQAPAP